MAQILFHCSWPSTHQAVRPQPPVCLAQDGDRPRWGGLSLTPIPPTLSQSVPSLAHQPITSSQVSLPQPIRSVRRTTEAVRAPAAAAPQGGMAHRWGQTPSRLRLVAVLCSIQLFLHYARLGITVRFSARCGGPWLFQGRGLQAVGWCSALRRAESRAAILQEHCETWLSVTVWVISSPPGLLPLSSPACLWDGRTKARFPFKVSQKLALHVLREQGF